MIAARFYMSSLTAYPNGYSAEFGAVCRDAVNKEWAAATPSGQLKLGSITVDEFDSLLAVFRSEDRPEFGVWIDRDRDRVAARSSMLRQVELVAVERMSGWAKPTTSVKLRTNRSVHSTPWCELAMTIANEGAASVMLDAFHHDDTIEWWVGIGRS